MTDAEPITDASHRATIVEALRILDGGPLTVRCCACGSSPGNRCYGGGAKMRDPHPSRYRMQHNAVVALLRAAVGEGAEHADATEGDTP